VLVEAGLWIAFVSAIGAFLGGTVSVIGFVSEFRQAFFVAAQLIAILIALVVMRIAAPPLRDAVRLKREPERRVAE
jgi:hypothetical protein